MLHSLRESMPPAERGKVDAMISNLVKGEAGFWENFPDNPNWAMGTGPSTEAELEEVLRNM